jgi:hypothetical protein
LRKLSALATVAAIALALVVAAPSQATVSDTGDPQCVLIPDGANQWLSCLTLWWSHDSRGYHVIRASADLTLSCCGRPGLATRYSNLWKNVSFKEATKTARLASSGAPNYRVDYWNTADPVRNFPSGTRFHSTWQSVPDSAHPVIAFD